MRSSRYNSLRQPLPPTFRARNVCCLPGEELASSMMLTPLGAAFGLAGAVPLLAFGLALDRMDWEWIKKVDEITRGVTVQLFGTKRQVRCGTLPPLEGGNLHGCVTRELL